MLLTGFSPIGPETGGSSKAGRAWYIITRFPAEIIVEQATPTVNARRSGTFWAQNYRRNSEMKVER